MPLACYRQLSSPSKLQPVLVPEYLLLWEQEENSTWTALHLRLFFWRGKYRGFLFLLAKMSQDQVDDVLTLNASDVFQRPATPATGPYGALVQVPRRSRSPPLTQLHRQGGIYPEDGLPGWDDCCCLFRAAQRGEYQIGLL